MDRGSQPAIVRGVTKVRHNSATTQQQQMMTKIAVSLHMNDYDRFYMVLWEHGEVSN